jgi:hypothetical protein
MVFLRDYCPLDTDDLRELIDSLKADPDGEAVRELHLAGLEAELAAVEESRAEFSKKDK